MVRRTLVKVCGLTRLEDARAAHDAGADWLGMVIEGESPRRVSVEIAREITAALDGAVTVGVMVAPTPERALDLARASGVTRIQLHRVDPLAWPRDFPLPVSIVVGVERDGALTAPLPAGEHLLVLDTAHERLAGGTGATFPWDTARVVAASRDVMLAGGLGPENVGDAIRAARPWAVDASSRLESSPGIKDGERVRRFIDAVRASDTEET